MQTIEAGPVTLQARGEVALVRMDDGRGNALGAKMLEALDAALTAAEDARAVVLRGRDTIFSGGLDLPELAPLDRDGIAGFLALFDRVCRHLLTYPRPLVTAAHGAAVAGGAILLCAGDERLLAASGRVGLNEVQLGIFLPTPALEAVRSALGDAGLARAALTGRLFEGDERLRVGFGTEIADTPILETRALALAGDAARAVPAAAARLRLQIRRGALERLESYSAADRDAKLELWFAPSTREAIAAVVARLQRRPSA